MKQSNVQDREEHNTDEGTEPASLAALSGLRVLVVEDEPKVHQMITLMLSGHGAQVQCANSAAAGFKLLQAWRPDVLISDLHMPAEDGYSLIAKVRELPPHDGGRTPAMALTGLVHSEYRERAIAAGYQLFVEKPFIAVLMLDATRKHERDVQNPVHHVARFLRTSITAKCWWSP